MHTIERRTDTTGMLITKKRQRNENRRPLLAAIVAFTAVTADALAPSFVLSTKKNTKVSIQTPSINNNENLSILERYESSLFDLDNEVDDDEEHYILDDEELNLMSALDTIRDLRVSSGPNVLSSNEQTLLDESHQAETFLKNFGGQDSSKMEQIAIASLPQQLPQAPLGAFLEKQKMQSSSKKPQKDMQYATDRVSVEQEYKLGRLIQAGAKVFAIKQKLEAKLSREPTKQEWAEAAGFESTKDLRRSIAAYRTAKHKLVTANMGLVHSVVRKSPRKGLSLEEMIQEGSLGLLRAAELFDPSKGLRFSTYAVVWIKGMLSNSHVPELVRVPARERTKWNKIQQAAATWKEMNGTDSTPSAETIATLTGIPLRQVIDVQQRMMQSQYMVSLDAPVNLQSRSGSESTQVETQQVASIYDDDDVAERAQLQSDIIATLTSNLTPREARLMRLRYGLSDGQSRTLHQCADAMGLSYSRVYQLSQDCLEKLRKAADAQALEEYLMTIA